jgi:transcriptional regulator with XRE-family HTH domain
VGRAKPQRISSIALDPSTIRDECRRRGWSQEALARASGLSRPTISVAYRGGIISIRTANFILEAFDKNKPTLDKFLKRVS